MYGLRNTSTNTVELTTPNRYTVHRLATTSIMFAGFETVTWAGGGWQAVEISASDFLTDPKDSVTISDMETSTATTGTAIELDIEQAEAVRTSLGDDVILIDRELWELVKGGLGDTHREAIMDAYEAVTGRAPVTLAFSLDWPAEDDDSPTERELNEAWGV